MGQTAEFAAGSWIVRLAASERTHKCRSRDALMLSPVTLASFSNLGFIAITDSSMITFKSHPDFLGKGID